MLLAAVIQLTALASGALHNASGDDVHGLWFRQWAAVDPTLTDRLHDGARARAFTLSPLLGLPRPTRGQVQVQSGDMAHIRLTCLEASLSQAVLDRWLPSLPSVLSIDGLPWHAEGFTCAPDGHALAGTRGMQELADRYLLNAHAPDRWQLRFVTPTAFHGARSHIPLPMPNMLLGSWLRRWQELGPVQLPDDVVERLSDHLAVSSYRLRTVPLRYRGRIYIGCIGDMILRALGMDASERAVTDLLCAYSFWAGTGHHTAQGMGLTLPSLAW